MKTPILALSVLCVLIATACDRRDDPDNAPTPDASTADVQAPDASDPTAPLDEGKTVAATAATDDAVALGLLAAINDHEIQAAQQAFGKNVAKPVMDYARTMEKEHTENLVATKALGTLADTPEVQAMKDKGASERKELDKKSGKEYETAYIDEMVKGHADVLALIDSRMLALSSAGPVSNHMADTRNHVAMHLKAAQDLQAKP